jgi:hypothetical protein
MAEREGFEPPVPLLAHLISSQAQSATLSSLRIRQEQKMGEGEERWQAKVESGIQFEEKSCPMALN